MQRSLKSTARKVTGVAGRPARSAAQAGENKVKHTRVMPSIRWEKVVLLGLIGVGKLT
jgi:hypothetical protein